MKPIPQLRCNLLMMYAEEYDCSLNGTWSIDWSTRGTVRPYFGVYCLLFSSICIPLYLLSAQVIWTMRRAATYKILFFLAVSDIMALISSSFSFGIFLIMGEVYCHHPILHMINGIAAMFFFTFSCITCLILALNRMLELVSGKLCNYIFKGSRTWYFLFGSIIYPFVLGFFTPLLVFNSDYHLLIINPGIYDDDRYEYYNVAHIFNNTMMPLFSSIAYIIMLLYLLFKGKTSGIQNNSNALNRAAAMLSIQSGIIVVVHSTTGVTYMLFQYVTPTEEFLYIAQISWQLLHGIPPFVYLVFNPSLRDGVKQYAAPVRSSFMMMPSSIGPRTTMALPSHVPQSSQFTSQVNSK